MTERSRNLNDTPHSESFATTRWSVVLASADPELPGFRAAMQKLAQTYHAATRAFIAAYRRTQEEAGDLTQEFFLSWLVKGMPKVDPGAGSFRLYLKGALRHFVQNHARPHRARKAATSSVALTEDMAAKGGSAEQAFDRAYHSQLLAGAVSAMFKEYEAEGRPAYAEVFRLYYLDAPEGSQPTYNDLTARLGVKASDLTNWLAHGRRRLRRHVIRLVRDSVSDDEAFRREREALFGRQEGFDGLPR